ncbi:MAG: EscR/YscR/HrcR family type III secretion system export apparatus protein, partial [Clostridia bacterium]|nr:EscR/YscR/HrcR family type III secretion system export apparatus protein [Clostridia bacterium]
MWKMMEILTKTDEISSIFCDKKTKNPPEKENFFDKKQIEKPKNKNDVPTYVLIPSFVLSELKTAFKIGFVIFLPFLVIDLVVASVLVSMGMMFLPPTTIAMPFKLIMFVMVDG